MSAHARARWAALGLVCSGCFAEPPNVTGAGDESSGSSGTLGASSQASSDGSGPTGGSSSASSGAAPTSSTGPASSSGEDTDDAPGDTGTVGDTADTAGDSSTDGSGSAESDSSGGGNDPYGDCYERGMMLCSGSCVLDTVANLSACAPDCEPGGGCPDAGLCVGPIADQAVADVCLLPCTTDDECDGLCGDTGFTTGGEPIFACMWP